MAVSVKGVRHAQSRPGIQVRRQDTAKPSTAIGDPVAAPPSFSLLDIDRWNHPFRNTHWSRNPHPYLHGNATLRRCIVCLQPFTGLFRPERMEVVLGVEAGEPTGWRNRRRTRLAVGNDECTISGGNDLRNAIRGGENTLDTSHPIVEIRDRTWARKS